MNLKMVSNVVFEKIKAKLLEMHPFSKKCLVCDDLTTYKYEYQILKGDLYTVTYEHNSIFTGWLVALLRKHHSIQSYPICKYCMYEIVLDEGVIDENGDKQ